MFLVRLFVVAICVYLVAYGEYTSPGFTYHSHARLTRFLNDVVQEYPEITHLYSIGQSVEGRDLWVVAIASDRPSEHVIQRPELKYVGNIHGNEAVGRELLIHFIDQLVTGYGKDANVTRLLDSARVHVLASLNPDGFEISESVDCYSVHGRYNANGYDLNRNFPDHFTKNPDPIQPETRAIMNWLETEQFVLSGSLHGGTLVANYPYDNNVLGASVYSASPDDDVFVNLAKTYSYAHTNMYTGTQCYDDFPEGITNGASWYAVLGGMQDYNYIVGGSMELTLEISCCKMPSAKQLPDLWNANKAALTTFIMKGLTGIKGQVWLGEAQPAEGARVRVVGREDHAALTTTHGEFWRLLLPGVYQLQVSLTGYGTQSSTVTVPEKKRDAVIVTFNLIRGESSCGRVDYTDTAGVRLSVLRPEGGDADALWAGNPSTPVTLDLSEHSPAKLKLTLPTGAHTLNSFCLTTNRVGRMLIRYFDANNRQISSDVRRPSNGGEECWTRARTGVHSMTVLLKKSRNSSIHAGNIWLHLCTQ